MESSKVHELGEREDMAEEDHLASHRGQLRVKTTTATSWKKKFDAPTKGRKSWVRRIESKTKELQGQFGLDGGEELLDSFMCALKKKILLQGRMYIFDAHVCFSCSLFGYHKIKVIPIDAILSLRKMKNVGFPNSVEIVWKASEEEVKKEFFTSFLNREEAFRLILSLWEDSRGCTTTLRHDGGTPPESPEHHYDIIDTAATMVGEEDLHNGDMITTPKGEEDDEEHEEEEEKRKEGRKKKIKHVAFADVSSSSEPREAPAVSDTMQKVIEYSLPVEPKGFYDTFLSSKSDFFIDFHTAQGHKQIELSSWDEHNLIGPVRDLSFVTMLKGFRIGPSEALCHQTQRVRVYKNDHILFETSQVMSDIPYGDHFKVETRWDIFPDTRSSNSSILRIHIGVPFTKNTMWKKFIEKGVTDSLLEAYQMFKRLADQKIATIDHQETDDDQKLSSPKPKHPTDLLPDSAEDWDMILSQVEPKFRDGFSSLRKMQQSLADQNQFSLSKPKHRRNMSVVECDVMDGYILTPPASECEEPKKTMIPARTITEEDKDHHSHDTKEDTCDDETTVGRRTTKNDTHVWSTEFLIGCIGVLSGIILILVAMLLTRPSQECT